MKPSRAAGLTSVVVAVGCATLFVAINDWFGAGDLSAMFFWSLPLGGMVAFVTGRSFQPLSKKSRLVEASALAAIGTVAGIVWTLAAAAILGGWIGAFSFPVLYCWMIGGLAGGVAALRVTRRELARA